MQVTESSVTIGKILEIHTGTPAHTQKIPVPVRMAYIAMILNGKEVFIP
jgi:hypothetical protein